MLLLASHKLLWAGSVYIEGSYELLYVVKWACEVRRVLQIEVSNTKQRRKPKLMSWTTCNADRFAD